MNNIIKKIFICLSGTLPLLTVGPRQLRAANLQDAFNDGNGSGTVQTVAKSGGYNTGIGLETVAGKTITGIFSLLGIIFVLFTIYGGFIYFTASGNEEKTKEALSIIKQAIIGLVIILAAYAITYFIFKFFI